MKRSKLRSCASVEVGAEAAQREKSKDQGAKEYAYRLCCVIVACLLLVWRGVSVSGCEESEAKRHDNDNENKKQRAAIDYTPFVENRDPISLHVVERETPAAAEEEEWQQGRKTELKEQSFAPTHDERDAQPQSSRSFVLSPTTT